MKAAPFLCAMAAVASAVCAAGCAARATPRAGASARVLASREGFASYYGSGFDRRITASGVRFDARALVAAHPSYPFGTLVRVTNLGNGRSVQVQIIDRGPAAGPRAEGVVIDVSERAAQALGFMQQGRARVRLDVLRWGSPRNDGR